MKLWVTLMFSAMVLLGAETHYAVEDLDVREDGTLIEVKTQKLANGIGQFFYESGKIKSETPFKEGLRDGLGKMYYESGKLQSETPFKNDKIEGLKKEYYESGVLRTEVTFVNDQAEGVGKFYYPTGKLQGETPFKKNQPDGITKLFNPAGKLIRTIEFKEGNIVKGYDYNDQGTKLELSREELLEATKEVSNPEEATK
ncbi:toxin-antitoxin system YwqK family antitoxin [Sulfurospirillum diekertiae]|uniref:Toxin-antitoxin system YwqK family antitoxin n=1 Tax=Sulfurospirillum diekertiae TaxID=1854492 RepID=A0A6G9VVT7_9BACT|nr:toxin-antitoxin system YwqK family antitoxin [Sulfurospirillum diekertiae]QIR76789.1 toxin-antitoxin system YwqK family antitoxin [Sulfurospirillum diekertiae]QIR79420.1 toxin-antitoxin system YwqK family antitoxin [Sulfurospirillum diekertiae]